VPQPWGERCRAGSRLLIALCGVAAQACSGGRGSAAAGGQGGAPGASGGTGPITDAGRGAADAGGSGADAAGATGSAGATGTAGGAGTAGATGGAVAGGDGGGNDFSGSAWVPAGDDEPALWLVTVVGNELYGVTATQLVVSRDAAVTWQTAGPELPPYSTPTGIAVQGSSYLVGTRAFGVLRSSATASTWASANDGLPPAPDVLDLRRVAETLFVGLAGGAFASTDAGLTWMAANDGIPDTMLGMVDTMAITRLSAAGTTIFAANNRGDSFRGTPLGQSWTWTTEVVRFPWSVAVADGYLFMSCLGFPAPDGVSVVNRSRDDGRTWTAAEDGLPTGSHFQSRDLAVVGDMLFLSATLDGAGAVFGTRDDGASWTRFDSGLPAGVPSTMVALGSDVLLFISGGGVFRLSPR
jgi:hypothetical protein